MLYHFIFTRYFNIARITSCSAASGGPVSAAALLAVDETGSSRVGCNTLLGAAPIFCNFNNLSKNQILSLFSNMILIVKLSLYPYYKKVFFLYHYKVLPL